MPVLPFSGLQVIYPSAKANASEVATNRLGILLREILIKNNVKIE